MLQKFGLVLLLCGLAHATSTSQKDTAKPLKIILMAGQSNAVGHGYAEGSIMHWNPHSTNDCGGTVGGCVDPYPSLPPNLNGSLLTPEFSFLGKPGEWAHRDDVWIVYNESGNDGGFGPGGYPKGEGDWHGPLTVGYGGVHTGTQTNHTEIGPELGFGWAVGDGFKGQQVLLIKTAWGGKTLDIDFRPPSSAKANSSHPVGPYYRWMLREVADTLDHLEKLFPQYSTIGSYEIAGFAWHQGWNDACKAGGADPKQYEFDLANLIRDLRTDLKAPNMKVVVGTSGMCGFADKKKFPPYGYQHCAGACAELADQIIPAQLAVSKYPEFRHNVASVETRNYNQDMQHSAGNQCYHWNNNAQSYWFLGHAMGKAFVDLSNGKPTPSPPSPPSDHCEQKCKAAGHCCTGATSSAQHPSCAMGCEVSQHTRSVSECKAACQKNDNTCNWNLGGIPQNNCGSCPGGCGFPKLQDCMDGCEFGFPASCEDSCAKAGHYCVGATSSFQHPSCAMGCTISQHTESVNECQATCRKNDNTCNWKIAGIPQNNCGSCPKGNPLGVQECLDGCKFGFGSSLSFRDNWNGTTV